jgi:hypothetical protein
MAIMSGSERRHRGFQVFDSPPCSDTRLPERRFPDRERAQVRDNRGQLSFPPITQRLESCALYRRSCDQLQGRLPGWLHERRIVQLW